MKITNPINNLIYKTNQHYVLSLEKIENGIMYFINQFGEVLRFNNRMEHISMLGSDLKILSKQ